MNMTDWFRLFWLFIKVNLLTTSGPASVGLLYKETVGSLLTESEFVEAVGFSSVLPGSDALQLAMFVGHAAGGLPGALAALLGSIWLLLGIISLARIAADNPDQFVTALVIAVLMLGNVGAWLLCGWGVGGGKKWAYWLALAVLAVNIILSVTDEFGLLDLIMLAIDLLLLGLLLAGRKRFFSRPTA